MKKQEYCPKCGQTLIATMVPNEKPFYVNGIFNPIKQEYQAYSPENGAKLYRVELDCPPKEKEGLFRNKFVSHYGKYADFDLTREEVKEKYGI